MRRLTRYMLPFTSLLSLLLGIGVCVTWFRGARHLELAQWWYNRMRPGGEVDAYFMEFAWYSGTLSFRFNRREFKPAYLAKLSAGETQAFHTWYPRGLRFGLMYGRQTVFLYPRTPGFQANYSIDCRNPDLVDLDLTLAFRTYLALIATLVVPGIYLFRRIRSRRLRQKGVCRVCGYDLRASPERCPECGTVAKGANMEVG